MPFTPSGWAPNPYNPTHQPPAAYFHVILCACQGCVNVAFGIMPKCNLHLPRGFLETPPSGKTATVAASRSRSSLLLRSSCSDMRALILNWLWNHNERFVYPVASLLQCADFAAWINYVSIDLLSSNLNSFQVHKLYIYTLEFWNNLIFSTQYGWQNLKKKINNIFSFSFRWYAIIP